MLDSANFLCYYLNVRSKGIILRQFKHYILMKGDDRYDVNAKKKRF